MSGIYLLVWDSVHYDRILKPTTGGYPHITLAYTGNNLTIPELKNISARVVEKCCMRDIVITGAKVNTFFNEKRRMYRHDVLLTIGEDDSKMIEDLRTELLMNVYPEKSNSFCMREPHITRNIFWNKEQAIKEYEKIQELLPIQVTITGVAID